MKIVENNISLYLWRNGRWEPVEEPAPCRYARHNGCGITPRNGGDYCKGELISKDPEALSTVSGNRLGYCNPQQNLRLAYYPKKVWQRRKSIGPEE